MAFCFQLDEHAVPVFFITKDSWTIDYRRIIEDCLQHRRAYVLVQCKSGQIVEFICDCRADFHERIQGFDNCFNKL